MTNEEKILEMLTRIDSRLGSVETRLDFVESELKEVHEKVDDLAESQAELRTSVNAILDWTDTVSTVVPIVPKIS